MWKAARAMRINVRFAGAGGQGVILASVLLAKAYGLGENYYISQTQSYGPEARGGACKAEVVISDKEIDYMKVDEADVFVAMNQVGYDKFIDTVKPDAMILINSTLVKADRDDVYAVPGTEIAEDMGKPFVVNMVMLGALTKLIPKLHYPKVNEEIKENFVASLAGTNIDAYNAGFDAMKELVENRKDEWQEQYDEIVK
jgi:2-oxoglutarate ferredoxin oxidoreductase subunit gamma